jgi:hypothetical protein
MSSIVIKGNTSGQIELAAPAVAGTNTLTLPASSGTLLTTTGDGSGLTGIPAPSALSTASGSAPSYSARAWVNFNGTGTVAIRDSGNVSSITDNGNGDYDINLTTAMPDTNGSIGACAAETVGSNTGGMRVVSASFSSTTVIKVSTLYQNGQVANPAFVGVQVFR